MWGMCIAYIRYVLKLYISKPRLFLVYISIISEVWKETYCNAKMQVLAVQHGPQSRVAYPSSQEMLKFLSQFNAFLIWPDSFQLVEIQDSCHQPYLPASVHTAGQAHSCSDSAECKGKHLYFWWGGPHSWSNRYEHDQGPDSVFWPTPHDNFTHFAVKFVQDAVSPGLFKVPSLCTAHPVWQMLIESVQEPLA